MRQPFILVMILALCLPVLVAAQTQVLDDVKADFVVNLRKTDIAVLAEQVSEITERTLVIDPGLTGEVTVISTNPLTQSGVWQLFQAMLRVRGFVAVDAGAIWEVVPETEALAKAGGQPITGRAAGPSALC